MASGEFIICSYNISSVYLHTPISGMYETSQESKSILQVNSLQDLNLLLFGILF